MFAVEVSSAWPATVIPIASPPFSVANFVVAAFASSPGSGSGDGGYSGYNGYCDDQCN